MYTSHFEKQNCDSELRNNEARTAAVGGYILFSGIK